MSISGVIVESNKRPVPAWIRKELLSIGGTADDGKTPFLRFIHPEDAYVFSYGSRLPRYWESRKTVIKGYRYIAGYEEDGRPIHRIVEHDSECLGPFIIVYDWQFTLQTSWKLEAWMPPEKYMAEWNRERYVIEGMRRVDALGEPPLTGGYTFIASLDGGGTPQLKRPKSLGGKAIEYVKKIWAIMQADTLWDRDDWRKAPTPEQYAKLAKEENERIKKGEESEGAFYSELIRDEFMSAKRWLFNKENSISIRTTREFQPNVPTTEPVLVDPQGRAVNSSMFKESIK